MCVRSHKKMAAVCGLVCSVVVEGLGRRDKSYGFHVSKAAMHRRTLNKCANAEVVMIKWVV